MRHPIRLVPLLLAMLLLTGCGAAGGADANGAPGSSSQAPIDQREPLETYATRVLPTIAEFHEAVSAAGAGEYEIADPEEARFPIHPCGDGQWVLLARTAVGAPVDLQTIIELGDARFPALGFSTASVHDNGNGPVTVRWFDAVNGGHVAATVKPGSHTGLGSTSECRPIADPDALKAQLVRDYPRE